MDEDLKKVDKEYLQTVLQREPTESELDTYSKLMDKYSVKLNAITNKYVKS